MGLPTIATNWSGTTAFLSEVVVVVAVAVVVVVVVVVVGSCSCSTAIPYTAFKKPRH